MDSVCHEYISKDINCHGEYFTFLDVYLLIVPRFCFFASNPRVLNEKHFQTLLKLKVLVCLEYYPEVPNMIFSFLSSPFLMLPTQVSHSALYFHLRIIAF